MEIEGLYNNIVDDLEKEAIKKFESKKDYTNWSQTLYEQQGIKAYRLKVPEVDKIIKKYITQFKELSFEERIHLSNKLYKSEYLGQTSFGLKLLELCLTELTPQNFEILDEISGYLTHWGPTDSFSLYIMQPLLKKYPNETKKLLVKYNTSNHIWKKRISVVTFTRKIGTEGMYVDFLLKLCDNLIWDKEDLVRKAVGWALKDNMIGKNKLKVLEYVKELRKKGVSSTITLYAIRNLKGKEREDILDIKLVK